MNILYYIYLLFMIIFLCLILNKARYVAAIKVRWYLEISLVIFLLRYIALMIFRVSRGTRYIYVLRSFAFINALSIIFLCILFLYIFLKRNSSNFKYNYALALAFLGGYYTLCKLVKCKISYNINFGYVIDDITSINMVITSYLTVLSAFIIIGIMYIDKENVDSKRVLELIIILSLVIIENVMYISGFRIVPYAMISDVFVLYLSYSVVNKLNKKITKA